MSSILNESSINKNEWNSFLHRQLFLRLFGAGKLIEKNE